VKIAIVVHSQTGNTAQFARAIADKLRIQGHETDIELLRVSGRITPRTRNVEFKRLPEVSEYDVILFGGPVWAFNASPAIMSYISTFASLKHKRVLCFVTHGLPRFLGAARALGRMQSALELLGAEVLPGVDVAGARPSPAKMAAAAALVVERIG
jgi:flavodoxin